MSQPSYRITLSQRAQKELARLLAQDHRRILEKLQFYSSQTDPLTYAVKLKGHTAAYRFRVGSLRVITAVDGYDIIVDQIGHRRDIYR